VTAESGDHSQRWVAGQRRTTREFDELYAEGTPPWDIGRPQPALQAVADAGGLTGRVLDSGCGTGEHTLMAAALGLEATGIDGSPTAIAAAERKAAERGRTPRFLVHDVLDLQSLEKSAANPPTREREVEDVCKIVRAGGEDHEQQQDDSQTEHRAAERVPREFGGIRPERCPASPTEKPEQTGGIGDRQDRKATSTSRAAPHFLQSTFQSVDEFPVWLTN